MTWGGQGREKPSSPDHLNHTKNTLGPVPIVGYVLRGTLERVSDVTRILEAAQKGDPKAADQLLPMVYEELRRLAMHKMANEAPGHTLQPTALVHEAWLRLVGNENKQW